MSDDCLTSGHLCSEKCLRDTNRLREVANDKTIPIKPTEDEKGMLALMRLNKLLPRKEIEKTIRVGRFTVQFLWRSRDNFMGRFGGGWNWHVGVQWSSRTVMLFCLVFMLRLSKEKS